VFVSVRLPASLTSEPNSVDFTEVYASAQDAVNALLQASGLLAAVEEVASRCSYGGPAGAQAVFAVTTKTAAAAPEGSGGGGGSHVQALLLKAVTAVVSDPGFWNQSLAGAIGYWESYWDEATYTEASLLEVVGSVVISDRPIQLAAPASAGDAASAPSSMQQQLRRRRLRSNGQGAGLAQQRARQRGGELTG
jgi:hypothetical protein